MDSKMLEVKNLKKYFSTNQGILQAVDDISFELDEGKTLGLVGESGCGKSTTGRVVLRLIEPTEGKVFFEGNDILSLNKNNMRELRKRMQIIFQDPFASLNPRKAVSELIGEPLIWNRIHKSKKDQENHITKLMEIVGLERRLKNNYPHELDGGRRQRIGIARALALEPKFIVCDEPVSALDVSIQAQILNLLKELQKEYSIAYLFITHNLSVVNHFSNDIAVMYLGKIVEKAPVRELFNNPLHPYTKSLLSAIPVPDVDHNVERVILKGEITSPINMKDECRFAPRCNFADEGCFQTNPELTVRSEGHFSACHKF